MIKVEIERIGDEPCCDKTEFRLNFIWENEEERLQVFKKAKDLTKTLRGSKKVSLKVKLETTTNSGPECSLIVGSSYVMEELAKEEIEKKIKDEGMEVVFE